MSNRIPAYEGREPYLFISYAHLNNRQVMPIIESLFADKYRVWYDEGIAPGSEWPKNIEEHLHAASAVLIFVSKESLQSPNCENEVVHAGVNSRPVFQFSIEEETHHLLSESQTVTDYAALREKLDEALIGDGVTGYHRDMGTAKKGNFWTSIIAVAVGLIVALGVSIYGLNAGWFDSMLPGLASQEAVEEKQEEVIQTNANVITHGIIQQTNQALTEEIPFASEETREILYQAIGFENWGQETPLTYENLTTCPIEEITLNNPTDEVLTYLQYFTHLHRIRIQGGEKLNTLEPLLACANLETVYLTYWAFPVEIPENAPFTVEFMR